MNRLLFVLALAAFSGVYAFGQDLEQEAALQGKINYEVNGQEIILRAQAENTTMDEVVISFDFFITGADKNNNALSNDQSAQAKLGAGEAKDLAATRIAVAEVKEFEAVLLLYFQDILVDADTLAYAADKQEQEPGAEFEEDVSQEVDYEGQESGFEFGGLVIDNTRTRAGRDLYDIFYSQWEGPPGAGDYYIKLEEFPGRGRTTRLVVWLDDERIVETNLQPNYEYLEGLAGYVNSRLERILRERAEAGENLDEELRGVY